MATSSDHEKALSILAEIISLLNAAKQKPSDPTLPAHTKLASNEQPAEASQIDDKAVLPSAGVKVVANGADVPQTDPGKAGERDLSAIQAWARSHVEIFVPNKYNESQDHKSFWNMVERGHISAARYVRVRDGAVKRELLTYPCRNKSKLPSHAILAELGFSLEDCRTPGYASILLVASENKDTPFAKYLLEWGLTVDDVRKDNCSALEDAIDRDNLEMVQLLMDTGLQSHDVRNVARGGLPQRAVVVDNLDMLKLLVLPNAKGYLGLTLNDLRDRTGQVLKSCCARGNVPILDFLLDFGLTTDDIRRCDAFMTAAKAGHKRVCEILFERGRLTSQDVCQNNNAALRSALKKNNREFARWLIKTAKLA
jgi:hypothetical protein